MLAPDCVVHNNARMNVRRGATIGGKHGNRVREVRRRRELSQNALAERLKWNQQKLSRIESGETKLTFEDAVHIASSLELSPIDLFADMPVTVPLRYAVCSRFSEKAPPRAQLSEPFQRIAAPPRLERPDECVAIEVLDNSADRIGFPVGSFAIMRERAFIGRPPPGAHVVVARFEATRKGRLMVEVLVGLLAPNAMGDVMVALRSSNKELPPMVLLRGQAERGYSLGDRPEIYVPGAIDVTPRPDDAAEILGRIESVIAPIA